jgi:Domain of unknown function (DUF4439)
VTGQPGRAASELQVLQRALAGENAAVYGYGVAGAHLQGAGEQRARAADTAHRARRDQLIGIIEAHRATPEPAAAAYRLPFDVRTPQDAALLATEIEDHLAAVWADAVGVLDAELRRLAAGALQETAVRAATWRGGSVPFPGLPEPPS